MWKRENLRFKFERDPIPIHLNFPIRLDPDDDDDDKDTFSKADVEKIVKKALDPFETKMTALSELAEEEKSAREDLEDVLIEAAGGEEAIDYFMKHGELPEDDEEDDEEEDEDVRYADDDDDDSRIVGAEDVDRLVRGLQKRFQKQLDTVQTELEGERQTRLDLAEKALENKRDQLLADALVKNDVVDVNAGLKLLRENMEYDEDTEEFSFKTSDGIYMEPGAGVAEALPDFLRKPLQSNGGSGTRGTASRVSESRLTTKRSEVEDKRKRAQVSGNQQDITDWQKEHRELKSMEESDKAVRTG